MSRKKDLTSKWESLYQFRKEFLEKKSWGETVIDYNGYMVETNKAIYTMLDGNVKRAPKPSGKNNSRKN